jgi:hypothetical protein
MNKKIGKQLKDARFPSIIRFTYPASDEIKFTHFICSDCRNWMGLNKQDVADHLMDHRFSKEIAQGRTEFLWEQWKKGSERAAVERALSNPVPAFVPLTDEEWAMLEKLPCVEDVEPCTEVLSTRVPDIIGIEVESAAMLKGVSVSKWLREVLKKHFRDEEEERDA